MEGKSERGEAVQECLKEGGGGPLKRGKKRRKKSRGPDKKEGRRVGGSAKREGNA